MSPWRSMPLKVRLEVPSDCRGILWRAWCSWPVQSWWCCCLQPRAVHIGARGWSARTRHVHVASACCMHAVMTDGHGTHVPCAPGPPQRGKRGAELLCARVLHGSLCVLHTKAAPLKLSFFCRLYRVSVVFRESVWRVSVTAPPPKHGLCERPCVLIISVVASERGLQLALTRFVPR